ncbi:MAG: diguanylate cyclase [Clostridiaceae bacterium]|nr:diguanylate cyclase [Clostridiaceae bacterium]
MHIKGLLKGLDWFTQKKATPDMRRQIISSNIQRGRILAKLVIAFDMAFALSDIIAMALHADDAFPYPIYLFFYLLMIAVNVWMLLATRNLKRPPASDEINIRLYEGWQTGYLVFMMTWGSMVSLLDQTLYSQIMVCIINITICSIIFMVQTRQLAVAYLVSTGVLFIGLPFFQNNSNILIGHYINLAVFLSVAWVASRLLFQTFCHDLEGRMALEQTNQKLADEIEYNKQINEKLSQANFQLRHLSLIDELTGIANRRGMRNFISHAFGQSDIPIGHLSVMMIDIDHFKAFNDQYGHEAGDRVLAYIAGEIAGLVHSPLELAVRWGGEEFIFLSFVADRLLFYSQADKLRRQIEALSSSNENTQSYGPITVSIGVSTMPVSDETQTGQIINTADRALYAAKAMGRNHVCQDESGSPG